MKVPILLLLLSAFSLAAEKPRAWTDSKGRSMTGTLLEKDQTHVKILVKGKRHRMPIDSLSEADQKYIATADVYPAIEMEAKTTKVASNEAYTKIDARRVSVSLANTMGREFTVRIVWIGDQGSKVGFHALEETKISADGEISFSTTYDYKGGKLRDYSGYAVGVADANGQWSAVSASQKPFERFIYERTGEEKK